MLCLWFRQAVILRERRATARVRWEGGVKREFLRNEANKSFVCNETANEGAPRETSNPVYINEENTLEAVRRGQFFLKGIAEVLDLHACRGCRNTNTNPDDVETKRCG